MSTVKVLQKIAAQVQAGESYESGSMQLLPYTGGRITQMYNPIQDESIAGNAFRDIPQQGTRKVEGSGVAMQLDPTSIGPILEAGFGNAVGGVYTLNGENTKKLSVATLDSVNCVRYSNVYVKTIAIEGSIDNLITCTAGMVVKDAQDRAAKTNFPSVSEFNDSLNFQEAGGVNGYVRIGDANAPLSSSDDVDIDSFSFNIDNKFDHQYSNTSRGILTPVAAQGGFIDVSGSFTIARHNTDQYQDWADAHTPLQMSIMIYKSATSQALIEIPRFVVSPEITEDDIAKINVDMTIGRNGVGSSYKNANMAFVSPIRVTIVNS